jgi:hypothetical protein
MWREKKMKTINDCPEHWHEPILPARISKEWSFKEKLLLPVALIIAVLFDRLIVASMFRGFWNDGVHAAKVFPAVFWLCYLVVVYVFYWQRLKRDFVAWFAALCAVLLCVWNFVSRLQNAEFSYITLLVVPGVLMAHAVWVAGGFKLKNSEGMMVAWFEGWVIKPFSGLVSLFGAADSVLSKSNKTMVLRVVAGVAAAFGALVIIVPLLMGADQVFNHHITLLFSNFNPVTVVFHSFVVVVLFGLFYSFLWNLGFGETKQCRIPQAWSVDIVVSSIVLGSITAIYVLFCLVQFTYLFAGAGLPSGMTYAEYAREGFAQTVTVCAINLLLFGAFLRLGTFGEQKRGHRITIYALLGGLLVLTGIMLVSGAVRLNLYIDAFGLTWLRLLSAWFIIYLFAVIVLCAVRLFYKKYIPIVPICALMLLVWYVFLGYLNPDNFVYWYNAAF